MTRKYFWMLAIAMAFVAGTMMSGPVAQAITMPMDGVWELLFTKVTSLETTVSEIDTSTEALESKIADLETKTDLIDSKVSTLDTKTDSISSKLDVVDGKSDSIKSIVEGIDTKLPVPMP